MLQNLEYTYWHRKLTQGIKLLKLWLVCNLWRWGKKWCQSVIKLWSNKHNNDGPWIVINNSDWLGWRSDWRFILFYQNPDSAALLVHKITNRNLIWKTPTEIFSYLMIDRQELLVVGKAKFISLDYSYLRVTAQPIKYPPWQIRGCLSETNCKMLTL